MDRVLIVCEEAVFSGHVEKTLIEVGFEVAIATQEADLSTVVQGFKPDILIVKGDSPKLSSLRVGQSLKTDIKYTGKVILILNKTQKFDPNDLNRVKMDYLLFEPVGAVKVVSHVLNLLTEQREVIRNRLLKLTESDKNFREKESGILGKTGKSFEQELKQDVIHVTGKKQNEKLVHVKSRDGMSNEELDKIKAKINQELTDNQAMHHGKIESYNNAISNIDADLKKGLSKKKTYEVQKKLNKEFAVDPGQEKLDSLDEDRRKFAVALVKKTK